MSPVPVPDFILGIDPGLQGAICLLDSRTLAIVSIFDMPTTNGRVGPFALAAIVEMCKVTTHDHPTSHTLHAAVELVSSMPRQSGAFNFGVSAGVVHGVLGALNVPFTLVQPAQWKGAMGLRKLTNETQQQNKSRARALAAKLWPDQAGQFKRIKDDGRAEGALLARYYANKTKG